MNHKNKIIGIISLAIVANFAFATFASAQPLAPGTTVNVNPNNSPPVLPPVNIGGPVESTGPAMYNEAQLSPMKCEEFRQKINKMVSFYKATWVAYDPKATYSGG